MTQDKRISLFSLRLDKPTSQLVWRFHLCTAASGLISFGASSARIAGFVPPQYDWIFQHAAITGLIAMPIFSYIAARGAIDGFRETYKKAQQISPK